MHDDHGESETLAALILNAPPEYRHTLAAAFARADMAARHTPAHGIPNALRALWLAMAATNAKAHGDPAAEALTNAAAVMLDVAAAPLLSAVPPDVPDSPAGL